MTTAYSRAELDALEAQMMSAAPAEMKAKDLKRAPVAQDVAMAGTNAGALIRLAFKNGKQQDFFLNCVVATELMVGLYDAGEKHGWWGDGEPERAPNGLALPVEADLHKSLTAVSLRTSSSADGSLIAFTVGRGSLGLFMPKAIAMETMIGIKQTGDTAGWWAEDMTLIPNDGGGLQ